VEETGKREDATLAAWEKALVGVGWRVRGIWIGEILFRAYALSTAGFTCNATAIMSKRVAEGSTIGQVVDVVEIVDGKTSELSITIFDLKFSRIFSLSAASSRNQRTSF